MTGLAEILKAGLSTTIQDGGRPGQRHLGVPLSGAADALSLSLANAAIGNVPEAAGLECTLQGPSIRFYRKTMVALAGADMDARLNGIGLPRYAPIDAEENDILSLGGAKAGARGYIAFAGGLAGNEFLGSRSTYAPAGIGGVDGRALREGDVLENAGLPLTTPRNIPESFHPLLTHEFFLRAIPGPEAGMLQGGSMATFFSRRWTVGRRADRMGLLLEGERLSQAEAPPMASSPVFPGAVQCPQDGAPILLLADAQTVGGYPRIAQIIAADLPLAGQMRPGDHLWVRRTSVEEARDIAAKKTALLSDLFPVGFYR